MFESILLRVECGLLSVVENMFDILCVYQVSRFPEILKLEFHIGDIFILLLLPVKLTRNLKRTNTIHVSQTHQNTLFEFHP